MRSNTMPPDDFLPLTRATPEIRDFTGQVVPSCYNLLKRMAYDGSIPAELVNGRLGFWRKHLPEVCAAVLAAPRGPQRLAAEEVRALRKVA